MADYEGSIEIDRAPGDVWDFVADLERTPRWRTSVQSVVPPDVMEVGATFGATTRVLGREWRWKLMLDEFEPPTALTYSVAEGFADMTVAYRLSPLDERCRFTLVASSQADRLAERLLEPIASRVIRRQTNRHLRNLKEALEAAEAGTAG